MFEGIDLTKVPRKAPKCLECGDRCAISTSDVAYPDEPELHGRPIWLCRCGAFSRCRPGSLIPSARPAGPETRAARHAAYQAYQAATERLWDGDKRTRYHASVVARCRLYADHGIPLSSGEFGWLTKDEAEEVTACFEAVK